MPDLLLELFSEEIPARMQRKAAGDLRRLVTDALVAAGLTYEGAKEHWTPRRLVLDLRGLTARSADISEEKKGPRTDAPQQAIDGFLRGAGLTSVDQAERRADPKKGEFYVAVIRKSGRDARDILAEILPAIIRDFPWPKSMRWGEASREPGSLRWVRPLHSILCTFGAETEEPEVVEFEVGGVRSGNVTRGHRFMAPDAFAVKRFDDYAAKLEAAKVVLDAERRKAIILTDARNLAFAQGFDLVEDEGLLEEVSGLVEWPVVLMGRFEEGFLEIPDEVIRLTIRENQKCFVLRGPSGPAAEEAAGADAPPPRSGGEAARVSARKLTNRFLLVANIEASDGGAEIARGSGKVVNARLSDARYFWRTDLQIATAPGGFDKWVEKLDTVTFHAKLGSQGERVKRIVALARELAPVVGADPEKAARAAYLAKADLQSQMVFEFPELQGRMGRRYAEAAGEDPSVARAIEEHYSPLGPSDAVPTDPVSVAVALADKLDTLVGFWVIDEKPTGSKDPYALRRAALGVIRLVAENRLDLRRQLPTGEKPSLLHIFAGLIARHLVGVNLRGFVLDVQAAEQLEEHGLLPAGFRDELVARWTGREAAIEFSKLTEQQAWETALKLLSFFHDRLKVFLRDNGARHDLIDAVVTPKSDDLLIVVEKVRALQSLIESEDGRNLLAGYKRAANILAAEEKKGTRIAETVDPALLAEPEEKTLFAAIETAEAGASAAVGREDFSGTMSALAALRGPVDAFFEKVLVNADDAVVRANRLALLARIRAATATVADFARIAG